MRKKKKKEITNQILKQIKRDYILKKNVVFKIENKNFLIDSLIITRNGIYFIKIKKIFGEITAHSKNKKWKYKKYFKNIYFKNPHFYYYILFQSLSKKSEIPLTYFHSICFLNGNINSNNYLPQNTFNDIDAISKMINENNDKDYGCNIDIITNRLALNAKD